MLLRSMQNTRGLADAKAENDALRDDAPLVVVGCTSKQSVQSVREATTASGVDNAAHDWRTPLNGYFTLREAWSYAKNNWGQVLMSSADRVARIWWATHAIIVSNTHALPAEYKCLK